MIQKCQSAEELDEFEIHYIAKYRALLGWTKVYNLERGGKYKPGRVIRRTPKRVMAKLQEGNALYWHRNKGKKMSEETKEKLRIINTGKIVPKWIGDKISRANKGKKYRLGTKTALEHRLKISERMRGNTHTLGHKLTLEHKKKISDAHKGRAISDITRIKISESHQKKGPSPKFLNQLARMNSSRIYTPELRAKIGATRKLTNERIRMDRFICCFILLLNLMND
jgi:hypothetical protein